MKIAIGNDHAATSFKFDVKAYLEEQGHQVINVGTDTNDSCNYPEFAKMVADKVVSGEVDCGVLICGTGAGMAMAADKVPGIRAACVSDATTARLIKEHNNANVITFGARIIGFELAKDILDAYLGAEFLGGRHQTRVDMINALD